MQGLIRVLIVEHGKFWARLGKTRPVTSVVLMLLALIEVFHWQSISLIIVSDIQSFVRVLAEFYCDGLTFSIIIVVVFVFVHKRCLQQALLIWHINVIVEEV